MCITNKQSYDTFSEAQTVINRANNATRNMDHRTLKRCNRNQGKRPKRAYKCSVCGKYHITSLKKQKPNKQDHYTGVTFENLYDSYSKQTNYQFT